MTTLDATRATVEAYEAAVAPCPIRAIDTEGWARDLEALERAQPATCDTK